MKRRRPRKRRNGAASLQGARGHLRDAEAAIRSMTAEERAIAREAIEIQLTRGGMPKADYMAHRMFLEALNRIEAGAPSEHVVSNLMAEGFAASMQEASNGH